MLPREIVQRAIERRDPPRLPINYCNRDWEFSDTFPLGMRPAEGFEPSGAGMTEWGYVWHKLDETMGQPKVHPLSDWGRIQDYVPPDPYAPGRLEHLPEAIATHQDRFLKFGMGITGFNIVTFLRGFEDFLMDLYLDRARVEQLLDLVWDFENGIIEQMAVYPADAVAFGDDWGTQKGLMIAPTLWREVFKPRYVDQFARVHRQGKKVWFHTCGDVHSIIGDLIEAGVDVLELLPPDIFGVERLASEFGGQVCFCCAIDHQRRAISGTREEINAYARLLVEQLGAYHGGFIAYIEDYASLGMSEQNYQSIRQAFHSLSGTPM
jgi:uroporphyrinogen decarboxylase